MTKKWDRVLIFGLLLAVILSMAAGFDNDCETVRENVLRLHMLANSDSEEDQALKLRVRDAILRETAEDFAKSESQIETMARAEELLPKMKAVAEEALAQAGSTDAVRVALVNMYFETREYDGTILPAGYYDAVRIELGAAEGHNWWCVLFPQLCIGTAAEGPELEQIEKLAEGGWNACWRQGRKQQYHNLTHNRAMEHEKGPEAAEMSALGPLLCVMVMFFLLRG